MHTFFVLPLHHSHHLAGAPDTSTQQQWLKWDHAVGAGASASADDMPGPLLAGGSTWQSRDGQGDAEEKVGAD